MSSEQEGPVTGPTSGRAVAARVPWQVRCAGWLVAVEALAALVVAVVLAVRGVPTAASIGLVLGQASFFLLVAGALAAVARALVAGGHWARTPAIVTQLLLLPVVYSLIGPSREPLLGIVAGLLVASCFLLLIGEAARQWMESEGR
ncbi:MAG: hypothetical protein AB7J32_03420 [Pseudonocardia sp.]